MTPVYPVLPVWPVYPVEPVLPVGPVVPVGPVAPVLPTPANPEPIYSSKIIQFDEVFGTEFPIIPICIDEALDN